MIHPARFLFNAGSTPKQWNQKMLTDQHFKILAYELDCSKVFANTEIKGGVAISFRNAKRDFGLYNWPEPQQAVHATCADVDF